jgi:tetratricopeptide (TPR) repeat protein
MALRPPPQARDARAAELAALQVQLDAAIRLHQAGKLDEAERAYAKILDRAPSHPDALNLMGVVQSERGRNEMAVELLSRAARLVPKNPAILNNLGRACVRGRRYEEAIEALERAIALEPGQIEAYRNLINAHRLSGNVAEARHFIGMLRRVHGDAPGAAYEEARVLADLGDKAEARAALEKLTRDFPGHSPAWFQLVSLDKVGADDPVIGRILGLIAEAPEPSTGLKWLCYAAGKALDDIGEYDAAFAHFARAKRQDSQTYEPARTESFFGGIRKTFTPALFEKNKGFGVDSNRPIFIVGMPRSGTTLTEQILASHRDVFGGGELEHLSQAMAHLGDLTRKNVRFPDTAAELTAEGAAAVAFRYLRRLNRLSRDAPRVTDKMPHNFQALGLLAVILPRAQVIHCIRDPIDTCLSCFMHEFAQNHSYNQSLEGLGHYYNHYRRLMEHWDSVLPARPFVSNYEEVTQDQRRSTEEMLNFLGLDWDESTTDFHSTNRLVATPSNWQVRKPIYTSSVKRWRKYEKHLGPLIDALEPQYVSA